MQLYPSKHIILSLFLLLPLLVQSRSEKFRCMWREDPATTMVVGWNQASGDNPVLYYDTQDFGTNIKGYGNTQKPQHTVFAKGMNNNFARLTGLKPNTVYYFVVGDSEGYTNRMSFQTLPNIPNKRLSIIAGGDSRNHRDARCSANLLVSKLRPHCIFFGGDMTGGDTGKNWQDWLEDWQYTISKDGRLTPIIVARGNHEASNKSLVEIFDVKSPNLYYAFSLGGNLLRVYTLNSMIATGGNQRQWLQNDLSKSQHMIWKFAQYHHTIRPHTERKPEQNEQLINWATLFAKYQVDVVCESDAHVVKSTWPIRPSTDRGSHEGFIRDDNRGTVYLGEGCWGAPLRDNNDDKPWTRNSGSFNQFKWIFVDKDKIEVRTVKTDGSANIAEVPRNDIFNIPVGLNVWNPSNGDVIYIYRKKEVAMPASMPSKVNVANQLKVENFEAKYAGDDVKLTWTTENEPSHLSFEVQFSLDGKSYDMLEKVIGKGNGSQQYVFNDKLSLNTLVRYRLMFLGSDGKKVYLEPEDIPAVSSPKFSNPNAAKLYTDPIKNTVSVNYELADNANVTLHLLDKNLTELSRLDYPNQTKGRQKKSIDLSKAPAGNYVLLVKANQQMLHRFEVVRR